MDPADRVIKRLRAEFLEVPGLRLHFPQAQRLCGVDWMTCQRGLDVLVKAGFLNVESDGAYARPEDAASSVVVG